jgi:hypothetical protein
MVLSSPLTWKGIAQPQSAEVALASVAYD